MYELCKKQFLIFLEIIATRSINNYGHFIVRPDRKF